MNFKIFRSKKHQAVEAKPQTIINTLWQKMENVLLVVVAAFTVSVTEVGASQCDDEK